MLETEKTVDLEGGLDEALARLKRLVESSEVEEARAYVKEVEARWPEDARARKWARVLAPPVAVALSTATGRDRRREFAWLKAHAHEYPGCWLAVDGDRLIAASPRLNEVDRAAREAGVDQALLHFQPGDLSWI